MEKYVSTFLGFKAALISPGATTAQLQSAFITALTNQIGPSNTPWQILRRGIIPTSIVGTYTTPANAFDMTSNTYASCTTLPVYIGFNSTAGFIPVNMYIQSECTTSTTSAPLTFTLDYSANGSTWTTLQTWTGQINWTSMECRKFAVAGATSQTWWRLNVTALQSGTTGYINNWVLEDASGNWITNTSFFDSIPPTTETIGNYTSREVLRWTFPANLTTINIKGVMESMMQWPMAQGFYSAIAGAVTCSCTINGATVSYTGISTNTSLQNARGLYDACKASVNANFTAYNWVWFANQTGFTWGNQFYAIQKTPATNATITSANITTCIKASYFGANIPNSAQIMTGSSINIDLLNGFIYYLQVCSRGIALTTKTSTTVYSPLHACYGDNASAIAQVPVADLAPWGIPCTPAELIVGTDNVNVLCPDGYGYPTHYWGVADNRAASFYNSLGYVDYNTQSSNAPFTRQLLEGQVQDYCTSSIGTNSVSINPIPMYGSGIFSSEDSGSSTFSIHKLGASSFTFFWQYVQNFSNGYNYARYIGPSYTGLDWYKWSAAAPTNEQLIIAPCQDFTTSVAIAGLTSDTTINVVSTTGFPIAGYISLDGEIIKYTGITTTSFTGCVRTQYNSVSVTPLVGTSVLICGWWLFMVSGLLFTGYTAAT